MQVPQKQSYSLNRMMPYLLISPTLAIIVIFLFYPMANVFRYSLFSYNISKPYTNGFAGLGNFIKIFTDDPIFWGSLLVSVKWVLWTVSVQLVFGMILALVLNKKFRCRGLFRTILFSPWAISGILTSMLFILLYNEHMGFINSAMTDSGLWERGVAWTANMNTVFGAIVAAEIWRGLPFFIIIFLAALQSISTEIYESADIDGAGFIRIFWFITLPFLKNSIVFATLLRIIWEFNDIDVIYVITKGGPSNATLTLGMYTINQAIKSGEFGYGSALNVVSFIILLIFIGVYLKLTKYSQEVTK